MSSHVVPIPPGSSEQLAEDLEGFYIDGGFAVEFDVSQDDFRQFIPYCSGQGYHHRFFK